MSSKDPQAPGPNVVDIHVGGRIRLRRKLLGVSQQQLAEHLRLTFQQVQKYESGSNRISASKLYETARLLETPLSYFFDGLQGSTAEVAKDEGGHAIRTFLNTVEGPELAGTFLAIHPETVRRKVLELVRAVAEAQEQTQPPEGAV